MKQAKRRIKKLSLFPKAPPLQVTRLLLLARLTNRFFFFLTSIRIRSVSTRSDPLVELQCHCASCVVQQPGRGTLTSSSHTRTGGPSQPGLVNVSLVQLGMTWIICSRQMSVTRRQMKWRSLSWLDRRWLSGFQPTCCEPVVLKHFNGRRNATGLQLI